MRKFTSERLNRNDEVGKAGLPPAPRQRLQAESSSKTKPLAPFADDLAWSIQASSNDVVRQALAGQKDDPGPNDITIR